jgi:hypothetical protein
LLRLARGSTSLAPSEPFFPAQRWQAFTLEHAMADGTERQKPDGALAPQPRDTDSKVPHKGDLTRDERPGGALEMPEDSRARRQRPDSNSNRDSNDRGSGVST